MIMHEPLHPRLIVKDAPDELDFKLQKEDNFIVQHDKYSNIRIALENYLQTSKIQKKSTYSFLALSSDLAMHQDRIEGRTKRIKRL